jgi:hypothetical protein
MHKSKLILCFLYFLKNLASNKKRKPISKAKHSRGRKLLNKKFGLSGLGKELQLRRNKIWKARRRIKTITVDGRPVKQYTTDSMARWMSESRDMD